MSSNFGIQPGQQWHEVVFSFSLEGNAVKIETKPGVALFRADDTTNLKKSMGCAIEFIQDVVKRMRMDPSVRISKEDVERLQGASGCFRQDGDGDLFQHICVLRTNVQLRDFLEEDKKNANNSYEASLNSLCDIFSRERYSTLTQSPSFEKARAIFLERFNQLRTSVEAWEAKSMESFTDGDLHTYFKQRKLLDRCLSIADQLILGYETQKQKLFFQLSKMSLQDQHTVLEPLFTREQIQKIQADLKSELFKLLSETDGAMPQGGLVKHIQFRKTLEKICTEKASHQDKLKRLGELAKQEPLIVDTDKVFREKLCLYMRLASIEKAGKFTASNVPEHFVYRLSRDEGRHLLEKQNLGRWIYTITDGKEYIQRMTGHGVIHIIVSKELMTQEFSSEYYLPPLQTCLEFHPMNSGKISTEEAAKLVDEQDKSKKGSWLLRYTSRSEWMALSSPVTEDELLNQPVFPNTLSLEEALQLPRYSLSRCVQPKA
jgi:hypothetical protein